MLNRNEMEMENNQVLSFMGESVRRLRPVLALMVSSLVLCVSDIAAGHGSGMRLLADLYIGVIALSAANSTFMDRSVAKKTVFAVVVLQLMLSGYYIMCHAGFVSLPGSVFVLNVSVALSAILLLQFVLTLSLRVLDIKSLMKTSSVWTSLNQTVESVHILMLTVCFLVYMAASCVCGRMTGWHLYFMIAILVLEQLSQLARLTFDVSMVFLHKHERTIYESMKISCVEAGTSDPETDEMYKELYERILTYFEENHPYLNSNLTINDIAAVVFSNRLYISRAISQYTGRNFCQFVNYYRVMHSIQTFRARPGMRVSELATCSGFNSLVSFAAAFRLFMRETPSDWCRKEKAMLLKKKK